MVSAQEPNGLVGSALFEAIIAAATEYAVVATDLDGVVTVFNAGAERMLGYRADEVIGRVTPGIFHEPAELVARAEELGVDPGFEVFAFPARRHGSDTRDWTFVRQDGSHLPVSLSIALVHDPAGREVGFVGIARDLTVERQARDERSRVAEQFSKIFEGSPVPTLIVRVDDGRIVDANPACLSILVQTREAFVGHGLIDAGFWPHPERRGPLLAKLAEEGRLDFADTVLTGEGHERDVYCSVEQIELDGRACLVILFFDVTEREHLRRQLQDSEETLQALLEFAPAVISARGADGRLLLHNERYMTMFRRSGDEHAAATLKTPEVVAGLVAYEQQVVATGAEVRGEVTVADPVRGDVVHEFVKFPLRDAQGAVYAVGTIATDVTKDRLAHASLRESEERFRQMAENIDEAFLLWEQDTIEILYVSPAIERLTGLTPEQFRDPAARLAAVHADDHGILLGPPGPIKEVRILKPDGEIRWLRVRNRAVATPSGERDRGASVISDFTDQRLAEQAVQSARTQAQRANQAKSEFLSRMSHELRTPLNAILGFGQLLESDARLEPAHRAQAELITRAGRHLLDLVDEVLDIAQIESGQLSVSLEHVGLGDVFDDALALVHPMARVAGVAIIREPIIDDCHVRADRQRLTQVLLHLLTNAVKYTHRGGEVRLRCETLADGIVRVVVADTGIGIAPNDLERLFTPFVRLGAERSDVEGTGLGLALSKQLVEAMEGSIRAESQPGIGSRFLVDLGSTEPPSLSAAVARPALSEAAAPRSATPWTVLFIEDNQANVRLMQDILERRPEITLAVAGQGRLGVELAHEHRPALILLDLNLPDMNGHEVLRHLRADPTTAAIPVAVVSADATDAHIERLLAMGVTDYLTKPFSLDRILAVVDRSDPGRPATVLYIEDDLANRTLMVQLFAREFPSFELLVAGRGDDGVRLAAEHRPALVLLDGHLPDMTGEDVVVALRAEARTKAIPIVMVSGRLPPAQGLGPGVTDYLVKPIVIADLHRIVDGLVRTPA